MNEVSIQASGGENTPGRGRASTLADLQSREETAPSGESSADEARDGGGVRGVKEITVRILAVTLGRVQQD